MIMMAKSQISWKGKTVYCLLRSPPQQDILTYQGEKFHKSKEFAKNLYNSNKKSNGVVTTINVHNVLCETIRHVNKEHIGAFYRTTNGEFFIVLKEVELKDRFFYEINYKGNVGDTDHSFRILLLPTCRRNVEEQVSQMMFLWQCSSPQLFQTTLWKNLLRIQWIIWCISWKILKTI